MGAGSGVLSIILTDVSLLGAAVPSPPKEEFRISVPGGAAYRVENVSWAGVGSARSFSSVFSVARLRIVISLGNLEKTSEKGSNGRPGPCAQTIKSFLSLSKIFDTVFF